MKRTTVAVATALSLLAATGSAVAQEDGGEGEGTPARGSVKIEDHDFDEPSTENEPMVGCAFRIDFFGFVEQEDVPISIALQPPSGEDEIAALSVDLQDATGDELSGSLAVDITEQLSQVPPADTESYDYKIRVEVVVKETPEGDGEGQDEGEGTEVTKSKQFFIDCEAAVLAFREVAAGEADEVEEAEEPEDGAVVAGVGGAAPEMDAAADEEVVRPTAVPAGSGGLASTALPVWLAALMLLGGSLLAAPVAVAVGRRARRR